MAAVGAPAAAGAAAPLADLPAAGGGVQQGGEGGGAGPPRPQPEQPGAGPGYGAALRGRHQCYLPAGPVVALTAVRRDR